MITPGNMIRFDPLYSSAAISMLDAPHDESGWSGHMFYSGDLGIVLASLDAGTRQWIMLLSGPRLGWVEFDHLLDYVR